MGFLFFCNYGQLKKSLELRKEDKDMYLLGFVTVTSEWFFCKEELLQQFSYSETHEE